MSFKRAYPCYIILVYNAHVHAANDKHYTPHFFSCEIHARLHSYPLVVVFFSQKRYNSFVETEAFQEL